MNLLERTRFLLLPLLILGSSLAFSLPQGNLARVIQEVNAFEKERIETAKRNLHYFRAYHLAEASDMTELLNEQLVQETSGTPRFACLQASLESIQSRKQELIQKAQNLVKFNAEVLAQLKTSKGQVRSLLNCQYCQGKNYQNRVYAIAYRALFLVTELVDFQNFGAEANPFEGVFPQINCDEL